MAKHQPELITFPTGAAPKTAAALNVAQYDKKLLHVTGLGGGETIQVFGAIDTETPTKIGADIVADGFVDLSAYAIGHLTLKRTVDNGGGNVSVFTFGGVFTRD